MVFGHSISFSNYPQWSEIPIEGKHITISPVEQPQFYYVSLWSRHLNCNIRYLSFEPFSQTIYTKPMVWALQIENLMTLIWYPETKTIGYVPSRDFTLESLRFWIYHTFLPLLFQMEGTYHILHAGGIQIGRYATLFTAPAFGGKSTLTASFLEDGFALLGDDTIAIERKKEGVYCAWASYPFYKPFREVGTLGYEAKHMFTKPSSSMVLFVLQRVNAEERVEIEQLEGIAKFQALHRSAFVPIAMLKEKIFTFEMMLLDAIEIYSVTIPWGMENLSNVKKSIIEHIGNLEKT